VKYWWRRRKGRPNLILFGVLGPATFCAWPGTISWLSYTALFNHPDFPPAENPVRIGQWSTTIALMLAVFTAIDHFVLRRWKGEEMSELMVQSYELVTLSQDQEALCSGALAPEDDNSINRAQEGRVVEQQAPAVSTASLVRRATERRAANITSEVTDFSLPPKRSATK
jgi:hypothetical protein